MQNTHALEVDASREVEADGIANEIDDLVGFLRRFASMMSGGENYDKLHGAANLIEDLVDALDRERKEVRDVEAQLDQRIRAQAAAQAEIGNAKAELNVLQNEMADQRHRAALAHEAVFNEAQVQSLRADAAERQLREATDEFVKLQAGMAEIGKTLLVVPVSTMDALRAQFEFLGRQFALAGDATSQAMCEVGACTIAEAVEDGRAPADEAN
jgi:chromosome segregation ATPase